MGNQSTVPAKPSVGRDAMCLTVASATHPRLGVGSPLSLLDQHTLRTICEHVVSTPQIIAVCIVNDSVSIVDAENGRTMGTLHRDDFAPHAAVAAGGRVYVVGETETQSWFESVTSSVSICTTCVVYDIGTDTWSDVHIPWSVVTPRGVVAVGTRVIITWALDGYGTWYSLILETTTGVWTRFVQECNELTYDCATALGRTVCTPAMVTRGSGPRVGVLDPATKMWVLLDHTPRVALDVDIATAIGDRIWCIKSTNVIGIGPYSPTKHLFIYDTATGEWSEDTRRYFCRPSAMTSIGDALYVNADGTLLTYDTVRGIVTKCVSHIKAFALVIV